ncbi:MAG: hypothetical protein V3R16_09635 [Nitrospirales bacterium]
MTNKTLREAVDLTCKALDADDRETETAPVGVKWLLDLNHAVFHLRAALADSADAPEGPWEELRWLVNLHHGVGKAGNPPSDDEWTAAIAAGRKILLQHRKVSVKRLNAQQETG